MSDCDICSACKEHTGFEDDENEGRVSECCGAPAYDVDEDAGKDPD